MAQAKPAPTPRGNPRGNPFPIFPLEDITKRAMRQLGVARAYKRHQRPRDRIWASDLGKCPRAVWLAWRHPSAHDDNFSHTRGAIGHAVEDMMALKLAPLALAREISYTSEKVSGRCDFILSLRHRQIPLECKSTYGFQRSLVDPWPGHVLQLRYYIQQEEAPYGLLCYVQLSNYSEEQPPGTYATLRIKRDDAAVDEAVSYLWDVVHDKSEPSCRAPEECFDCANMDRAIAAMKKA